MFFVISNKQFLQAEGHRGYGTPTIAFIRLSKVLMVKIFWPKNFFFLERHINYEHIVSTQCKHTCVSLDTCACQQNMLKAPASTSTPQNLNGFS